MTSATARGIAVIEEPTITSPVFLQSAEDLAQRLERIGTTEALIMATEARDLLDEFRSWATRRPTEVERFPVIDRLFALNRRAMDWLARDPISTPPTSGVRGSNDSVPPASAAPLRVNRRV
jgi:hypothetical protein